MAGVKVDIKVNNPQKTTFKVPGKTLKEALKSLNSRDEWGVYDATQNVKSSAQTDKGGNVTSVTMVLNPVIELPEWSGYRSATKEQKASWDKMIKALEAHERKHHDIQVDCASDLTKEIKKAKTLDADALNEIISDQQDACQKKQDDYDTRSGHGAKEGVELDLDADQAS
jgi:predicted secreted Zn-dependent protease